MKIEIIHSINLICSRGFFMKTLCSKFLKSNKNLTSSLFDLKIPLEVTVKGSIPNLSFHDHYSPDLILDASLCARNTTHTLGRYCFHPLISRFVILIYWEFPRKYLMTCYYYSDGNPLYFQAMDHQKRWLTKRRNTFTVLQDIPVSVRRWFQMHTTSVRIRIGLFPRKWFVKVKFENGHQV